MKRLRYFLPVLLVVLAVPCMATAQWQIETVDSGGAVGFLAPWPLIQPARWAGRFLDTFLPQVLTHILIRRGARIREITGIS